MRRPRAILFDLGGTLLAEDEFVLERGLRQVLGACGPGAPPEALLAAAGPLWKRQLALRADSRVECSFACYLRLALGPGAEPPGGRWEDLEQPFWEAAVKMSPEPGIVDCLERLTHFGIPLGVISNSIFAGPTLTAELARHDLARPFRFIMSSADYGLRKPDPWIFELASHRLQLPANDLWYIGDSQQYDVAGSQAAGLSPLWYAPDPKGQGTPEGVPRLGHWDQLARLVGELL